MYVYFGNINNPFNKIRKRLLLEQTKEKSKKLQSNIYNGYNR